MMSKPLHNQLFSRINKGILAFACLLFAMGSTYAQQLRTTLFNETIGTVATTTAIDVHQATGGFDYDATVNVKPVVLNYTGSGDIRNVLNSTGYTGASAGANVFLTSLPGKEFRISGINTSNNQLSEIKLSYGVLKSNTFSNGSELLAQYSTDNGSTWTTLTFAPLLTGTGTTVWYYRVSTNFIPNASNVIIRFQQTSATVQFRIDDIKVDYRRLCAAPVITVVNNRPTTFCQNDSVVLDATYMDANSYQWYKNGVAIGGATAATYTAKQTGDYTVTVLASIDNPNDCMSTSAAKSIIVNPNPSVSVTTPAAFCQNRSADIVASGTGGTGTITYTWAPNPQNADNTNAAIYHVPTSTIGSTQYTVTATDANACKATATATATVYAVPAAPTVTASGNTTFCDGGSVTFTSSAANGNAWYLNGALINPAQNGTTYTADANGSYTVTQTLNGCESNPSSAQVVNEIVVSTPIASISQGSNSVCQNVNVVLSSTANSGNQWFADGVAINGATAATYTVPTAVAGTVSYTVKQTSTVNGVTCTSPASNGIAIEVKQIPAAPVASIQTGTNPACQGDVVVLTADVNANNQWFDGAVAINGATAQTYTASTAVAGTKNYSLTQTVNGCTSPASNTISQVVNAIPAQPSVSVIGSLTICDGGSVTLSSSTGTTYQWYKNGVAINGATNPTFTVNTPANDNGDYTVVVTNANGCFSAASAAKTVVENALPTVSLTSNPAAVAGVSEICLGAQATFTATAAGASPFVYMFNDGTNTLSGPSNTLTTATANTYTVTVSDANNCTSVVSNSIALVVNSLPSVSITGNGSPSQFEYCQGSTVTLTAAGNGGHAPYTYAWANGPATAAYAGLTTGTTYSVVATDAKGCISSAASQALTENANPTLAVTGNGTPTEFEYCQGGTGVVLTAAAAGGNAPYTYLWNDNSTAAAHSSLLAGTYSVVATDAKGCSSPSVSKTIVENANPTVAISGNGAPTQFEYCQGSTVTLTATASGAHAPFTYQWANGGPATAAYAGLVQGTPTPVVYSVVTTDAKGCSSVAATQSLTENANPTASIAGTGSPSQFEYCEGGTGITLTATPAGGNSPYSLSWNDNSTTNPRTNVKAALTDVQQNRGTDYTITVTDSKGCIGTATANVVENARPISLPSTAAASTNPANAAACTPNNKQFHIFAGYQNQFIGLNSSPTGGHSPYSFAWSDTSALTTITNATSQSPTFNLNTPLAASTYTHDYAVNILVTDAKGCVSTPNKTIVKILDVRCPANGIEMCNTTLNVTQCVPSASVSAFLQSGTYCLGSCTGTDADNDPILGGGTTLPVPPIPPVPTPTIPTLPIGGRSATTATVLNSLNAYPNPFNEEIKVAVGLTDASEVNVIITDMLGRVVTQLQPGTLEAGEHSLAIDSSNLAEGMYLCTVKTSSDVKVISLVKKN